MHLIVTGNSLTCDLGTFPCGIGKNGFTANKREGDLCTPLGTFPLRGGFYRFDRLPNLQSGIALKPLSPEDGWCDEPTHPAYNKWVRLPFSTFHEELWLEDHTYDVIVVVGYNDDPPVPGLGSAIFFHLAREENSIILPTAGCISLRLHDMQKVLAGLTSKSQISILHN